MRSLDYVSNKKRIRLRRNAVLDKPSVEVFEIADVPVAQRIEHRTSDQNKWDCSGD
jgi:hypothetical protein